MNTNNLKGRKLNDGTNKKGEKYARSMNFQPGYGDLLHIIAGLQKKVDRINQCVTLEGAKEYAASKGKNWSAHEEDITGSDGKPDGIKEVFECENKEDFSEIINSNINRYNEMSTQKLNQMFKVPGYKVTKIKGEIGLRTIKACEMNKSDDVSRIDKIEKEIQIIKDAFNQMSEQLDLIKHEVVDGHEW